MNNWLAAYFPRVASARHTGCHCSNTSCEMKKGDADPLLQSFGIVAYTKTSEVNTVSSAMIETVGRFCAIPDRWRGIGTRVGVQASARDRPSYGGSTVLPTVQFFDSAIVRFLLPSVFHSGISNFSRSLNNDQFAWVPGRHTL